MGTKRHPDFGRYVEACNYPGKLDEIAVGKHLSDLCRALKVKRKIIRLKLGWKLSDYDSLHRQVEVIAEDIRKRVASRPTRAAMAALAARAAMAAMDALDASLHRLTQWVVHRASWYWFGDPSFTATTWLGATTDGVRAWSRPLFEAFVSGTWILHWTEDVLYWVAKPRVHVDGQMRPHREDGPAVESDVEPLYFISSVLVTEQIVMSPETITRDQVRDEENAEVQRIMIEQMGAGKYLAECNAKLLDMDSLTLEGSAPRALMEDDLGNRWLVGTDGSTARVYNMNVPQEAKSCVEAHCMIAGFDESRLVAEA